MAALDANMALAELITSLDLSKVPDKLHCPGCNEFLSNAFKTPCCDQAICETCQSSINEQCPVCDHSPLTPDLCKPSKAVRTTAKAYLKTAEKKLADERAKTTPSTSAPVAQSAASEQFGGSCREADNEKPGSNSMGTSEVAQEIIEQPQPSVEASHPHLSRLVEANPPQMPSQIGVLGTGQEDVVDREVSQGRPGDMTNFSNGQEANGEVEKQPSDPAGLVESKKTDSMEGVTTGSGYTSNHIPNMGDLSSGRNGSAEYNHMMQLLSGNMGSGMANFGPMMGMSNMGMGPVSGMFGNMGGPGMGMAGMNGINMGMNMNFSHGQGVYGGWNNGQNMWNGPQSNNPNAFANSMGGDFGPNAGFGYNMSQPSNFHQQQQQQQQYTNGDFQSGMYGRGSFRGRGRGRGGFRGRGGGFNSNFPGNMSHSYQPPYEQQQGQIRQLQSQLGQNPIKAPATPSNETQEAQLKSFHDELAPGGQEETDEALGVKAVEPKSESPVPGEDSHRTVEDEAQVLQEGPKPQSSEPAEVDSRIEPMEQGAKVSAAQGQPPSASGLTEAYKEDLATGPSMPPPTAPVGPALRSSEVQRDIGFRGRGPGRFASRGLPHLHLPNGVHSSSKIAPDLPSGTPTEPKGTGIVGAPTGPKAMRASPVTPSGPRGRGGFQIVGRAAMMNHQNSSLSRDSEARFDERSQSTSPRHLDGRTGHSHSRSNYDAESDEERNRRHERRHRRSKRGEHADEEMADYRGHHDSRSSTPNSTRRASRRERDEERYVPSSKHGSSRRSHHHRHNRSDDGPESSPYDDEPSSDRRGSRPSKHLLGETDSRSSGHRDRHHHRHHHRRSRSSRHEDKDRHHDRDRGIDADREDRHRLRKRSRRDHEVDGDEETEASDVRHRSRRHKPDHNHDDDHEQGGSRNGRTSARVSTSSSHHRLHVQQNDPKPNGKPTTTSTSASTNPGGATTYPPPPPPPPQKDMHTLEREERNRERLLKEQQRRENAKKGGTGAGAGGSSSSRQAKTKSGGGSGRRTASHHKYEDEVHERMVMVENERARDRWR